MDPIGQIVNASGQLSAQSADGVRALEPGSPIYAGDVLVTGADGKFEAKFLDDSVLSQGPDSTLTLDEYVFNPAEPSAASLIASMSTGTFRMVTGKIADQNPDAVALKTPLASIGIRGTGVDMQIGPDGERVGIFSYDGHSVVITGAGGVSQTIPGPGLIVGVPPSGVPTPPRPYTPQEIQMFQSAAPILSVPGLQELSPEQGQEGQGEGAGEGEGEGEGQGEGEGEGEGTGEGEGEAAGEGEGLGEGEGQGEGDLGLGDAAGDGPGEGDLGLGDGTGEGEGDLGLGGTGLGDTGFGDTGFGEGTDPFGSGDIFGGDGLGDDGTGGDTQAGGAGDGTAPGESILVGSIVDLLGYVPDFDPDDDDDDDTLYGGGEGDFDASLYTFTIGTSASETLTGSEARDALIGLEGDDLLEGMCGDDFLIGDYPPSPEGSVPDTGIFDDTLFSTVGGNDTMVGGDGDDEFLSGKGNDLIIGDFLESSGYENTVIYDRPWDISGHTWGPTGVTVDLYAGTGDNFLSNYYAYGGAYGTATDEWGDTDTLVGIQNVVGSYYKDSISGNDEDNELEGLEGDDTLTGNLGADLISGGEGDDSMFGDDAASAETSGGNDTISGGEGNDTIDGGYGDDMLWGDSGADYLNGGYGSDLMGGGEGTDELSGNAGDDTMSGDMGDDMLFGGEGADVMSGGDDNDVLYGDAGNDVMSGDTGDDVLDGGDDNDILYGASGADSLIGGLGQDTIFAGDDSDADTLYWSQGAEGGDYVFDFESGEDKLTFLQTAFGNLNAGQIDSARFLSTGLSGAFSGNQGADTMPLFVYDTDTGQLYYDSDGNGSGTGTLMATFDGAPGLQYSDIEIVT
ncbi:hypothetical protein [Desulfocurvus sp. DL9XJH121]